MRRAQVELNGNPDKTLGLRNKDYPGRFALCKEKRKDKQHTVDGDKL